MGPANRRKSVGVGSEYRHSPDRSVALLFRLGLSHPRMFNFVRTFNLSFLLKCNKAWEKISKVESTLDQLVSFICNSESLPILSFCWHENVTISLMTAVCIRGYTITIYLHCISECQCQLNCHAPLSLRSFLEVV